MADLRTERRTGLDDDVISGHEAVDASVPARGCGGPVVASTALTSPTWAVWSHSPLTNTTSAQQPALQMPTAVGLGFVSINCLNDSSTASKAFDRADSISWSP
eukprot:CAMPEP_0185790282 /NCGR_PEP_ID=MMETSP1174-20130828/155366_1 /TAXON_ID=35687 /ORGANISM="Dictyocha speculum, Strain CCMP1381" /LENGTH=102 /DNA_ID=CAMNT_0028484883 /DNA_START=680 /DNA_END=985 /DNA_ORIENTATION=+